MSFSTSRPAYVPKDAKIYFHRVQEGETTQGIAAKYNVNATELLKDIGLATPLVGDVIPIKLDSSVNSPRV